jgi:tripartite-type tricarboxylate transporter receptor subunit TctC
MKRILQSLLVLALACAAFGAEAQAWPTRPLKVIIPFGPGSLPELVARIVFDQLSAQIGQSIVVEQKAGAGSTIGTGFVARSAPDGYVLLANSSAHTIAPALHSNLGYDPMRDLTAVVPLGVQPFVLVVSPASRVKTLEELVAAAKARPGALTFVSPGVGSASHLSAERFRFSAGVDALHVPMKGPAEALTEVLAGRADFFFMAMGPALAHIRDGKLAALALNAPKRSGALPDIPTLRERGIVDADNPTWVGLFAPAATPRDIVDKLHRETLAALATPRIREQLARLGVDPMPIMPKDFDAQVAREIAADAALVKAIGLKAE